MSSKCLPIETFTPEELARLADLRYVTDESIGFTRQRNRAGFYFIRSDGQRLRNRREIARLEALAIPPAWTDVWICRFANGHLQANGRDDRQRKQYIYHERWREISNLAKFWRLHQCPRLLPEIRRRIARDLRGQGLKLRRVLAGMVAILDLTSIRIGNEEYVRKNNSYGLTTLRNRHVSFVGQRAKLQFRAKGGLQRDANLEDRSVVRLLRKLKQLPGALVFQYINEAGKRRRADSVIVNKYLREIAEHPFTAKDFRTWKASALAAGILYANRELETAAARKRQIGRTIREVAGVLGNTPTVCRKYYVHPALLQTFLDGEFSNLFGRWRPPRSKMLNRDEQILARFLRRRPFLK